MFLIFQERYLQNPGITELFLYFWKWSFLALYFFPSSKKKKKSNREKFLYSRKSELSSSNIKNKLYFLIFQKTKTLKKFLTFYQKKACLIFWETKLFYISGNRNREILLIFQEVTFQAQKMKKDRS